HPGAGLPLGRHREDHLGLADDAQVAAIGVAELVLGTQAALLVPADGIGAAGEEIAVRRQGPPTPRAGAGTEGLADGQDPRLQGPRIGRCFWNLTFPTRCRASLPGTVAEALTDMRMPRSAKRVRLRVSQSQPSTASAALKLVP